ncbi:MAG: pilus assembly protein PilM, partial [Candidatus Omnitrophota bacterium]|nr:pilus assembly protein PilM [Candidatus Omnitrophota bacterium]
GQLGLYWGDQAFTFIATERGSAAKTLQVPFNTPIEAYQSQQIPEGLRYTTLIQKALRDLNIPVKKINLSLPAKDLIFRSFVIPWMNPEEVKNVVDFEAIKYMPIKLENLVYTYHPVNFTENSQKNIRILFVAIRKDVLEKYTGILENAGLEAENIEPAPVSLIRLLQKKGHVKDSHATAVIEFGAQIANITIVDQGVVHFVREFPLPPQEQMKGEAEAAETAEAKIFNDIRVSLSFYSRQNPLGKVDRIIAVSFQDLSKFSKRLSENLSLPVSSINATALFKSHEPVYDVGFLNAFGTALRDRKYSSANFDLSPKTLRLRVPGVVTGMDGNRIKVTGMVLALSIATVGLVYIIANQMVSGYKTHLIDLQSKQGKYEVTTAEEIETLKTETLTKLAAYKDIRMKSGISNYLSVIPQVLPEGTWLRNWEIRYEDIRDATNAVTSKISINLDGYVYMQNANEQFRVATQLAAKLGANKDFAKGFSSIDLVTVKQEIVNNYSATYFKIVCK